MASRMSVVVCCYNGALKLPACLQALVTQTLGDVEIIVVDDGSTDETSTVATRFGVRVVKHSTNAGLSAARNTGIASSTGDIVAFTDDDCVPDPRWLELLADRWRADQYSTLNALGGSVHPARTDTFARRYIASDNPLRPLELSVGQTSGPVRRLLAYLHAQVAEPSGPGPVRPVHSLVGANMSFRRRAFDKIGGFDPRITFGGEEEDICRRINEAFGVGTIEYDPGIVVRHEFEPTVRDTLRRRRAYGRGNARTFLKAGLRVPPVPPAAATAVAIAAWVLADRRHRGAVWLCLPTAWYFAGRRRRTSGTGLAVAFSGLKFLEEVSTFAGFVEGWVRFRRQYSWSSGDDSGTASTDA